MVNMKAVMSAPPEHVRVENLSLVEAYIRCDFDGCDEGISGLFADLMPRGVATEVDIVTTIAETRTSFAAKIEQLEKQGLRPATLAELLAKTSCPEGVSEGVTFALGTVAVTPKGSFVCYVMADYDDQELADCGGGDELPPLHLYLKKVRVEDIGTAIEVNACDAIWVLGVNK